MVKATAKCPAVAGMTLQAEMSALQPCCCCAGKAVIIMDARCIIQAANQVAHSVFGYGKNELRGRNINILIPP
jgi:hypothetical protein